MRNESHQTHHAAGRLLTLPNLAQVTPANSRRAGLSRRRWTQVTTFSFATAAVVVVAVAVVAGVWPFTAIGSGDPGVLIRLGAPLLRLTADTSATICVGALVFAGFFTRPQTSGSVSPAGYAALRTAARASMVWLVATVVLWPFDAAATSGLPLRRVLSVHAMSALTGAQESTKAWLVTIIAVAVVAVGCRLTVRWQPALVLAALAVFAILPPLAAGHSASDTGHDLATAAIMIHVPVAVVWLGTLIAVLRARSVGADGDMIARRYRRLSSGCWWLIGFSGLVDAAILAPGRSVLTTGYGLLLVVKVLILVAVGVLLLPARRAVSSRSRTVWLAAELIGLAVAFGLSVAMTDLPAPKFLGIAVSGEETLLGYNLTAAPTLGRLVGDWRIEVLFAPLCLILAAAYLAGLRRLRRSGVGWPLDRTMSWLAGCVVLLVATSSGLGRYAPAMFSIQAATHMLVGMLAPILFALGAPLTLAGKVLRPAGDGLPGPAEWLATIRMSALVRAATHPVWCSAVFVGAPFLLYFTPIFDLTIRFHWAHLAMDVVFLVIGYLFAWMIIGADSLPRPVPNLMRVGLLLAVMPADILFAAAILGSRHIIGDGNASANLYTALAMPWVHSLAADQRLGAYLALAIGEACVLLTLVVLVLRWRPAERDSDEADYRPLIEALRRRGQDSAVAEGAQPQAVGDHQQ